MLKEVGDRRHPAGERDVGIERRGIRQAPDVGTERDGCVVSHVGARMQHAGQPSRASAQITGRPKSGCTSNTEPASNTTSITCRMSYTRRPLRGTISRSSGTARGAMSSPSYSGGYDHADDGKYERYFFTAWMHDASFSNSPSPTPSPSERSSRRGTSPIYTSANTFELAPEDTPYPYTRPIPPRTRTPIDGTYMRILTIEDVDIIDPRPGELVPYEIVGPICESSDIFGKNRLLPPLEVGDHVAILDAGAYGSVMASTYNRRLLPAEVLLDGVNWKLIRGRQTIDEQQSEDQPGPQGRTHGTALQEGNHQLDVPVA